MRTLTPAYGRDYSSAAKAKADYLKNKDFILRDFHSPYDGKPCSKLDFKGETVELRYNNDQYATTVAYYE